MRDNNPSPNLLRRATMIGVAQLGLFGVLFSRLHFLQISQADEYSILADENRINIEPVLPARGCIVDLFGIEMAKNVPNFQIVLLVNPVIDVVKSLNYLSKVIKISAKRKQYIIAEFLKANTGDIIPIIHNLTWEEFANVNLYSMNMHGIDPYVGSVRSYPFGEIDAHIVGYVGIFDRENVVKQRYKLQGKIGLEKQFNKKLLGVDGVRRVEVNSVGRVIRELSVTQGKAGDDLITTLDQEVQNYTHKRMKNYNGSVVVMDTQTGEIVSLVSTPSFDPHLFHLGMSQKEWDTLRYNPYNPLLNKAVSGQYSPGSTFKIIVALVALEQGIIHTKETIECSGKYSLGTDVFHCWKPKGHGDMNLYDALKYSCDTYFYELSNLIGIDLIEDMGKRFGLGVKTNIDIQGEKSGVMPGKKWKKHNIGETWQKGETIITGIGQGYVLTTPLQLAVMISRFVNGGYEVQPHFQYEIHNPKYISMHKKPLDVKPQHIEFIKRALWGSVNDGDGTASGGQLLYKGQRLSGKTGTVQVRRISELERKEGVVENKDLDRNLRDHALFIGFAPYDKPKYAISVVLEHAGKSTPATYVARDVMKQVLKRSQLRMEQKEKLYLQSKE